MPSHQFTSMTGHTVQRFGPNEEVKEGDFQPGDFILTHGNAFYSALIRFGQKLRYWGKDRKYTWWNHAALIADASGGLIEALGNGVVQTNLSDYRPKEYHLIRLGGLADSRDRAQAVAYARWCVGEEYGWITILSVSLSLITGGKFNFGFDGQKICSGLVAGALERTDVIFSIDTSHIMPADLAKYFGVEPPSQ